MNKPVQDLPAFIRVLESAGQLKRVSVEVDPALEITEIATRVVKAGGPALLFEKVKGSPYPVAMNLFGSEKRMAIALGRHPAEIGEELFRAAESLMPPTLGALWRHRGLLWRAAKMPPRIVSRGPATEITESPNLDSLPILTCWPKDGGRFFTLPLVITVNPAGKTNVGMYRLHTFDKTTTGMHIQIERGGGAHYAQWESLNKPMPVAVALGGDPITILSSILPLPENMDELAFASFLRGQRVPVVHPFQWRASSRGRGIYFGRVYSPWRTANGGAFRGPFRPLQPCGALPGVSHSKGPSSEKSDLSRYGGGYSPSGRQVHGQRRERNVDSPA
ncbi:MAG: UbiD family decarboxylase [Elusimicrobia bacterium]|nr:UbiD family decarboxylase [Elusimicrobiota bacterium]